MKIAVISFTRAGTELSRRLTKRLNSQGHVCIGYVPEKYAQPDRDKSAGLTVLRETLAAWTSRNYSEMDALIFVSAAGIAVRAVAPHVLDKMTDPAVVVLDEGGHYAISLLSGHMGGANALAREAASLVGAQPVITTASDVQKKTAVDLWAKQHGLTINSRELAKQAEAEILDGGQVGFFCDEELKPMLPGLEAGCLPEEFAWESRKEYNLRLTIRGGQGPQPDVPGSEPDVPGSEPDMPGQGPDAPGRKPQERGRKTRRPELKLVPRILTLGIGCRKGVPCETIRLQVEQAFLQAGLDLRAVCRIASIDLKKEEPGICGLARELGVPFVTFSSRELEQIKAPVEESSFVRAVTGTGNVCERAALLAAGAGSRLIMKKQAADGVTVAAAWRAEAWRM